MLGKEAPKGAAYYKGCKECSRNNTDAFSTIIKHSSNLKKSASYA